MDKEELAKKLAAKSRLSEKEAIDFIETFIEVMADYFKKGEKVVIAEFGSFYIGDNQKIQFNPSAKLKDLVG